MAPRSGSRKPWNSGWFSGNEQRNDIGATQTPALRRSASATVSTTAPSWSTAPPTPIPRRSAAASAAASPPIASGARDDPRPSGGGERGGELVDRVGVRREAADAGPGDDGPFGGDGPVVGRHGHEDRPGRRLRRDVVGPRQRGRDVFGGGRLDRPLDVRLGEVGRVHRPEEGIVRQERA